MTFTLVLSYLCSAQIPYEGNRILSYKNKIIYGVFLAQRQFSMNLIPYDSNGNRIDSLSVLYEPNSNRLLGVNIVSGGLGIRLSIQIPRLDSDARRSETKEFGLGLAIYKRKSIWQGFYGSYDGMVDREKGKYTSGPINDPDEFIRRDIKVRRARLSYQHIFSHETYSFRAGYFYNERMLESGGSAIVRGRYSYFRATADSSFVPGVGDSLISHNELNSWRVHGFGVGGGYAYSFIFKEYFFIDFGLTLGFDFQVQKYGFNQTESIQRNVINPLFDMQFAAGYSEDRFYVVFRLDYDFNNLSMSSAEITTTELMPTLGFGLRLDAPKKLMKFKNDFNLE